jgi:hypothetical protein
MYTHDDIISTFRSLQRQNKEIQLLNVYKGVPISYPATIQDASEVSIRVRTDKYQIVPMFRESKTFIRSDAFPLTLRASVMEIDLSMLEAVLAGFEPTTSHIGDRTAVRVEPDDALHSLLQTQDKKTTISGELADVAQTGLALYTSDANFSSAEFKKGTEVSIHLRLPGIDKIPGSSLNLNDLPNIDVVPWYDKVRKIRISDFPQAEIRTTRSSNVKSDLVLHGVVAYCKTEVLLRRHRIGIRFDKNDPARSILAAFITQRQAEIIRELRSIYNLLFPDQH